MIKIAIEHTKRRLNQHWKNVHECDFLDECHGIVKHSVIQLLGGMKLDFETETMLNEVMSHFVKINTDVPAAPVFNKKTQR